MKQRKLSDEDLTRRALAAYFRADGTDQPADTSGVKTVKGKDYVTLHNVRGILAVYRVRNDGMLKRLKRWPEKLDQEYKGR